jgi:hypothetical protein
METLETNRKPKKPQSYFSIIVEKIYITTLCYGNKKNAKNAKNGNFWK